MFNIVLIMLIHFFVYNYNNEKHNVPSVLDRILNTQKEQLLSKSINANTTTDTATATTDTEDEDKNKIAEQIIGIQKIIDLIKRTE